MRAEAGLRQRIREAIKHRYPHAMVVGEPASAWTGKGRPDLYVLCAGRFVGLEIKTPRGKPSPAQLDRIRQVRRCGGWAWIVRSPAVAVAAVAYALRGGDNMAGDFDFLFAEPSEPPTQAGASRSAAVLPKKDGEDVEALLSSFETGPVDPPPAQETGDITAFLSEVGTAVEAAGPPQLQTTQEDVESLVQASVKTPEAGLAAEVMALASQAYELSRSLVELRNRIAGTAAEPAPAPKRRGSAKTQK